MADTDNGASYDRSTFWDAFEQDLKRVRSRVLIQSQRLSLERVRYMCGWLRPLIGKGVKVRALIQQPVWYGRDEQPPESEEFDFSVELLKGAGVHVDIRDQLDSSVVMLDQFVCWEGNISILGDTGTGEDMKRGAKH